MCWKKTVSRGTKVAIVGRAQQKQWRVARVVEQGRQSSGKQPEPQFALGPWIQAAKNGGGCLGMADVGGAFDIAAV